MEVAVFSKKKTTKEGKSFYTYFGNMTKKDGTQISVEFKFRESCGAPEGNKCPMNIVFDKTDANYSEKPVTYVDNDGVEKEAINRRVWITNWYEGTPYVDTSMDEFAE